MKKLTILSIFCLSIVKIYSQDYSIGINIPSIALFNLSVIGEKYITEKTSLNIGLTLRPQLPLKKETYYNNLKGIAVTPEYRFYLKGFDKSGIFLGGYLRYQKFSAGSLYSGEDYWSGLTINQYNQIFHTEQGIGLTLGYRIAGEKYTIDFFLGPRMSTHLLEVRSYHMPHESDINYSGNFEDVFGFSMPGFKTVSVKTYTNYDKISIPGTFPAIRIGFTYNHFFESKKNKG